MIIKRYWKGEEWSAYTDRRKVWCGLFLFGFIPLYIGEAV